MTWRICKQADLEGPLSAAIIEGLGERFQYHRKLWEYVEIYKAFDEHCGPGSKVLGFAVGREPLTSAFAREGAYVTATDQPSEGAGEWATTGQHATPETLNERGLCDPKEFAERVTFRPVDMREIPADLKDGGFDFVWSSCAFEHLGSIQAGLAFVLEAMECLKPGGVAVHTTEFNVSSDDETPLAGPTVLFRRHDFETLAGELRARGHDVGELVLESGTLPRDGEVDEDPFEAGHEHLKIRFGPFVATSAILVIRKARAARPASVSTIRKPKLLWISDAAVETGFARVTHNVLGWLGSKWDRHVLGLNTTGDPHSYPYPIYPSRVGGDFWGFGRFPELVKKIRPDVIVIQSDGWIVESFVEISEKTDPETGELIVPNCPPMIGFMPIEGRGMKRSVAASLSKLALSIFYTEFARQEAISCGHTGPSISQGLGVRRELYKPMPKLEARKRLLPDLPRNAFVVGNVNRNQPRKRLDLTVAYFAEWLKRSGVDAYLYLHCLERDSGFDLRELAHWHGINERVYMPTAKDYTELLPEHAMPYVYSALDVLVTTSLCEGFGLCSLEALACGVAHIAPEFAALGEWPRGAVYYVPVNVQDANFGFQAFGIGGVPLKEPFIEALDRLYRYPGERRALSEAGMALAAEPRFEWSQVAKRFDQELSALLGDRRKAAA